MSESIIVVLAWHHQVPETKREIYALVLMAYKATIKKEPDPKLLFIRKLKHDTTRRNGRIVKDRSHVTVVYKNEMQFDMRSHVTFHAYIDGAPDYVLDGEPEHYEERWDDNLKQDTDRHIWPEDDPGIDHVGTLHVRDGKFSFSFSGNYADL